MGGIDTACFLAPRLEGYLKQPVMDLSNHYLLLSTLKDPLLRPIYDYVLKQPSLQGFFDWCALCVRVCVLCVCVCVCVCVCCVQGWYMRWPSCDTCVSDCSLVERRSTRELCRPGYEVKYPPLSTRFEPVSAPFPSACRDRPWYCDCSSACRDFGASIQWGWMHRTKTSSLLVHLPLPLLSHHLVAR